MLDTEHFRKYIIRDTLKAADMWSQAAENLLLGTALVESNLTYLHQLGGGPALGLYQCEPSTHLDVVDYIKRKPDIARKVLEVCRLYAWPGDHALMWNLRYATLICRIHYLRIPEPLPCANDYLGLASYHKRHYNTSKGKTDIEKSSKIFQGVIVYV